MLYTNDRVSKYKSLREIETKENSSFVWVNGKQKKILEIIKKRPRKSISSKHGKPNVFVRTRVLTRVFAWEIAV